MYGVLGMHRSTSVVYVLYTYTCPQCPSVDHLSCHHLHFSYNRKKTTYSSSITEGVNCSNIQSRGHLLLGMESHIRSCLLCGSSQTFSLPTICPALPASFLLLCPLGYPACHKKGQELTGLLVQGSGVKGLLLGAPAGKTVHRIHPPS